MREIFIEILGVCGILCSVTAFQCKNYKAIMTWRVSCETIFGIQYLLLGAYTGMFMNWFGALRTITFLILAKYNKSTMIARIMYSGCFGLFAALTWNGAESLLAVMAKIVSTFIYGSKNVTIVRIGVIFTSITLIIYNIIVGSYAGIICDSLTIISIIVGIVRLRNAKEEQ